MSNTVNPKPPGSWVGILGGGQLGRMLAMEARRLDYRTCVLDPDPSAPAGQVADEHIIAAFSDVDAVRRLARRAAVVTYEFEHIDADAVAAAEQVCPVYPGSRILRMVQDRLKQKQKLVEMGFAVPRFEAVRSLADLREGVRRIGWPAVLKTGTYGYDGKGQALLRSEHDLERAYAQLSAHTGAFVLEEFVAFDKEISIICARGADGRSVCYPAVENIHRSGILDLTIAPARAPAGAAAAARESITQMAQALELIGLLAVEMFLMSDGRLLINEIAPRPHNSGHYTLEGCLISQFEQLLRAICGLPLGSTSLIIPAVTANLLGDLWIHAGGAPDFTACMKVPGVKLHLYGKTEARRRRKMGHLAAVAPTVEEAIERVTFARDRISGGRHI